MALGMGEIHRNMGIGRPRMGDFTQNQQGTKYK